MSGTELKLPFALDKEGKLVTVAEVNQGLACECTCPGCGCRLIARKGVKTIHHFAHKGENCAHGLQTAIHLAAKDIIARTKKIMLPNLSSYNSGKHVSYTYGIRSSAVIDIDSVIIEKKFNDIIPDIIVTANGVSILIEIAVTHFIDENKLDKIKKYAIPTIEIDLSSYRHKKISLSELESILLNDSNDRHWKWLPDFYVDYIEKQVNKHTKVALQNGEFEYKSKNELVVPCPIKSELRLKDIKAKIDAECEKCVCNYTEYHVFYNIKRFVLCAAKSSVMAKSLVNIYDQNPQKNALKAVQAIIDKSKELILPQALIAVLRARKLLLSDVLKIKIDSIELSEKQDYLIVNVNKQKLALFVAFARHINLELVEEMKRKNISVIELDLRDYFAKRHSFELNPCLFQILLQTIFDEYGWKLRWVINIKLEYLKKEFERLSSFRPIIQPSRDHQKVGGCPLEKEKIFGKSESLTFRADFNYHCILCRYCYSDTITINNNLGILCAGSNSQAIDALYENFGLKHINLY